jgi:capsular exopolysaccharide synthesis family protein
MELRHYSSILWRQRWIVLLTAAIATLVAGYGTTLMTAEYAATATLWVPASNGGSVGNGDIQLNDRLINTYTELATSSPVLAELQQQLGITPGEARSAIKAQSVAQTELLKITVRDPNPQRAAQIATSVAQIVIAQTQRTDAGRSLRVSLFAPAGVPTAPTWLGLLDTPFWRQLNLVLGLALGLLAGLAVAFVFNYLDSTLYTSKQIETATLLTTVAQIPAARKPRQLPATDGSGLDCEALRYLRTSLFADHGGAAKTVLITSASAGEGKSTVAANLACAIAQAGQQVILVDANLRRPALHRLLDLANEVGLSTLLAEPGEVERAIQPCAVPNLRVVTSGPPPARPAALLDQPRVASVLEQLAQRADHVVVDTPAIASATDAIVLAAFADRVLLVVSRSQAHQEAVQRARDELLAVHAPLAGTVINRADPIWAS